MTTSKTFILEELAFLAYDKNSEAAHDSIYQINHWSSFNDKRFSKNSFIEWLVSRANRFSDLGMTHKSKQFIYLLKYFSK